MRLPDIHLDEYRDEAKSKENCDFRALRKKLKEEAESRNKGKSPLIFAKSPLPIELRTILDKLNQDSKGQKKIDALNAKLKNFRMYELKCSEKSEQQRERYLFQGGFKDQAFAKNFEYDFCWDKVMHKIRQDKKNAKP